MFPSRDIAVSQLNERLPLLPLALGILKAADECRLGRGTTADKTIRSRRE
jgi:hypothetical protein